MQIHSTIWGSVNRNSPQTGRFRSITRIRQNRLYIRKGRKASPLKQAQDLKRHTGGMRYLGMSRALWWTAYERRFNRKTPDRR